MTARWPTLSQLRNEFGPLVSGIQLAQTNGRKLRGSTLRLTPDCTRLEIVAGTDQPTVRRVVELAESVLKELPKKRFWQRHRSLRQMVSVGIATSDRTPWICVGPCMAARVSGSSVFARA